MDHDPVLPCAAAPSHPDRTRVARLTEHVAIVEVQTLVLDAVLAGCPAGLTTSQITELVRREMAAIDADAVAERARRVLARRRAGFTALPDGQALLELLGPAPATAPRP